LMTSDAALHGMQNNGPISLRATSEAAVVLLSQQAKE